MVLHNRSKQMKFTNIPKQIEIIMLACIDLESR